MKNEGKPKQKKTKRDSNDVEASVHDSKRTSKNSYKPLKSGNKGATYPEDETQEITKEFRGDDRREKEVGSRYVSGLKESKISSEELGKIMSQIESEEGPLTFYRISKSTRKPEKIQIPDVFE